jgi:hypothetical protein
MIFGIIFKLSTFIKTTSGVELLMSDLEPTTTKVIIFTGHYRFTGKINLYPSDRVTDYVRSAEPFIALTDAEVMNKSGKVILTTSFLNVRRDKIEAIMPEDLAKKI